MPISGFLSAGRALGSLAALVATCCATSALVPTAFAQGPSYGSQQPAYQRVPNHGSAVNAPSSYGPGNYRNERLASLPASGAPTMRRAPGQSSPRNYSVAQGSAGPQMAAPPGNYPGYEVYDDHVQLGPPSGGYMGHGGGYVGHGGGYVGHGGAPQFSDDPDFGFDPIYNGLFCADSCQGACGPEMCGPCCDGDAIEVRGEYLLWWTKGSHFPPLVTTSPAGTPIGDAGVLGQPGTSILFGDSNFNEDARSGGRITIDYWFDPCHQWGIEANYFGLPSDDDSFRASSDGDPILARPFFNVVSGLQDASIIAFPGIRTGSIQMAASSDLLGTEVLLRRNCYQNCGRRVDLLLGYRYMQLRDRFRAHEENISIDPQSPIPVGTEFDIVDSFGALNQFNGADIGFNAEWRGCRWSLEMLMKLGIGGTKQRVTIDGQTTITDPVEGPETDPGGILALPTNIGRFESSDFTMLPEIGATIGYDLTCRLRFTVGYTLIYWGKVARAGEQINLALNPTQFPPGTLVGTPAPQFRFVTNDYWAQGLNLGLDLHF